MSSKRTHHQRLISRRTQVHPKSKFTTDEDNCLRELVRLYGENKWDEIAAHMPERNVRQCKERWMNYLSPDLNTGAFTEEEDRLLFEKYEELGPRWVKMTKFFKGRTDIALKNRYMVVQRKYRLEQPINDLPPRRSHGKSYYSTDSDICDDNLTNQKAEPPPVKEEEMALSNVGGFFEVKPEDVEDFWNEVFHLPETIGIEGEYNGFGLF